MGTEDSPEDGEDPESEVDKETIHRLCPTYATDINSPLRHVRTRIYFTSESHVHSLINVLRFSHLAGEYWHSYIPLLQLMCSSSPHSDARFVRYLPAMCENWLLVC